MKVWFVTVLTGIEGWGIDRVFTGIEGWGIDKRTWGYYLHKDQAVESLHANKTDMYEDTYEYAVIELIEDGIIANVVESQWFKWDKTRKGYYEIDKPNNMKTLTNFAIG